MVKIRNGLQKIGPYFEIIIITVIKLHLNVSKE